MTLYVSITTNTRWLLRSIKSVSWTNYLAWLWTIALKIEEFWIYWFCLVLYTILKAQSFIVQDTKSKCRKRAVNDQSFNSYEWPRQNFSLQYQADKPQEWRKVTVYWRKISWFNTKFSEQTLWELYGRQWGKLLLRSWEWNVGGTKRGSHHFFCAPSQWHKRNFMFYRLSTL